VGDLPFALLQLTDSACPTGGFAHSHGVEELFRAGTVGDAAGLLGALQSYVTESLAGRELVFAALAWDVAADPAALDQLVQERVATRLTRSARDAEGTRGQALYRVVEALRGPSPALRPAVGSHAVLFGAAGATLAARRRDVVRAFAFAHVSTMVQAAVRLGRIGPTTAQHLLGRLAEPLEDAVDDSEERCFGQWHGFSPVWELAQARHELAGPRMFVT